MVQIIPPGSNAICMIIIVCTLSVGKVKDNIWALWEYFAVSLSRLASTITIITTMRITITGTIISMEISSLTLLNYGAIFLPYPVYAATVHASFLPDITDGSVRVPNQCINYNPFALGMYPMDRASTIYTGLGFVAYLFSAFWAAN